MVKPSRSVARSRALAASLVVAVAAAACGGNDATEQTSKPIDACTLLPESDAKKILQRSTQMDSFQSGIGPGCIYSHGALRVGFNLRSTRLTEDRWLQEIVQPAVGTLPLNEQARLEEVDGPGDVSYWISGKTIRVLHVFTGEQAFDLFIYLGPKVSLKEHLREARRAAAQVLTSLPPLKELNPTPS